MMLDTRLDYENHIKYVLSKVKEKVGLLHKFQTILPRNFLIAIYKSFIRPRIDYGDIIYDHVFTEVSNLSNLALLLQ